MSKENGTSFQARQMCHHKQMEIKYFGNVVGTVGVKPDPSKVNVIKALQPPKDKQDLQSFLGMVNYLTRYISYLNTMTVPILQLLKKDTVFHFDENMVQVFNRIEKEVCNAKNLALYDPEKKLT